MTPNKRICIFRESKGLNQIQMAEKLGVSQQTYNAIENNNENFKTEILRKFVEMGMDLNWLITGHGEPPKQAPQSTIEQRIEETFAKHTETVYGALKKLMEKDEENIKLRARVEALERQLQPSKAIQEAGKTGMDRIRAAQAERKEQK